MEPQRSAEQVRRRAHKARLNLSVSQEAALDSQGHVARAVWNLLHEWYTCREGGIAKRPSIAEMDRQLRDARTKPLPDWEWLNDLPAQAMQQILKHYLRAWDRYFRGIVGPPRFKQRSRMAVDAPQAARLNIRRLNRRWGRVQVPFVGQVRFRWTRPLPGISRGCPGRITGARLVKDPLGWHICFRIHEPAVTVTPNPGPPIGIDRGVVTTLAISDGRGLAMPSLLSPGERRRMLGLERKAARQQLARRRTWSPGRLKQPMSRRHRRTAVQIAELRAREARRRKDWLHKRTTTDLAKSHGLIVVEDLRIANMTRSAHGTIQRPGKNVRAKTELNRSILGMAWGSAERMLAYKCPMFGGTLVKVDPRNSSIECARCGHVAKENRVNQAAFRCLACGHVANADTNAAQVVLKRGLTAHSGATPGCGGTAREARATVPHREPLSLRSGDTNTPCRCSTPWRRPVPRRRRRATLLGNLSSRQRGRADDP